MTRRLDVEISSHSTLKFGRRVTRVETLKYESIDLWKSRVELKVYVSLAVLYRGSEMVV